MQVTTANLANIYTKRETIADLSSCLFEPLVGIERLFYIQEVI